MTKSDIDQLIGLPIDMAVKELAAAGYMTEIYPKEAIIIRKYKNKTILISHVGGIMTGWTSDNPWEFVELE